MNEGSFYCLKIITMMDKGDLLFSKIIINDEHISACLRTVTEASI
jgi:hypothetical protein